MKQKASFIIFKGLSVAKKCLRPESVPLLSLYVTPLLTACYINTDSKINKASAFANCIYFIFKINIMKDVKYVPLKQILI